MTLSFANPQRQGFSHRGRSNNQFYQTYKGRLSTFVAAPEMITCIAYRLSHILKVQVHAFDLIFDRCFHIQSYFEFVIR